MNILKNPLADYYLLAAKLLDYLQSFFLLAARLYVAWVFLAAGLTKIKNWENTLLLFEYEYQVPLINFELAAYMGTFGELFLPLLLVLGVASRFGAAGLTVVNIIAVISLEEIAPAAYILHVIWGLLLAQIVVFGPGSIAADRWIKSKVEALKAG